MSKHLTISVVLLSASLALAQVAVEQNTSTPPAMQAGRAVLSSAADMFYVSLSGDDAAPGTQESPWKSIKKAAETLKPGQTVIIAAGVYREAPLNFRRSGEPGKPITFAAAPQATVILTYPESGPDMKPTKAPNKMLAERWKGRRVVVYRSVSNVSGNHLTFCGVTFEGWKGKADVEEIYAACSGMEAQTEGLTLDRCTFWKNAHCGLKLHAKDVLIQDCLFQDNGHVSWDHAIYADQAVNMTVRRCVMRRNHGWGLKMAHGDPHDCLIENNVLVENGYGILLECHNCVFRNNVIMDNCLDHAGVPEHALKGALVFRGPNVAGNIVENNAFVHNGADMVVDTMGKGFGMGNIVRNNVFLSVAGPKGGIDRSTGYAHVIGMSESVIREVFGDQKLFFGKAEDPSKYNFVWENNTFIQDPEPQAQPAK